MSDAGKKILVISQYFYPENFRINDICSEWVKRGYNVTVVTGIPNYPQGKFYDGYGLWKKRKECWKGIDIVRIPLIPRGNSSLGLLLNYFSFVISGFIWNLITQVKADRVFIFEVSPMTQALCGIQYAKRKKIPCYIYVQDLWPENVEIITGIHYKFVLKPIERMVDYIYSNCNLIFATSESFVEEIKKRVNDKKEKVVYWPQYAEEFYVPVKRNIPKAEKKSMFKIMFTGNIGVAQGLDVLPGTAIILKRNKCYVKFVLVGDGRNKERLRKLIKEHEVEAFFEFRGRIPPEDIPDVLSEGDIAFISFNDNSLFAKTIPAKLQTYMACGMPILAAATGETRSIIENFNCGVCCGIGDEGGLANAIIMIKRMDEEILQEMSLNSLEYSRRYFNKKVLMDKMDKYLNGEN